MKQVEQQVTLLAHSQLSAEFKEQVKEQVNAYSITSGQAVSMTAIRTCYSPKLPTDIVADEAKKYFGEKAKDGGTGSEADRLFRLITGSGHSSTLEHVSFTFAIEGVTRALLAQLTRHRAGFSFSVQSQRYVRFGTTDRSGGASYVIPDKVVEKDADEIFKYAMTKAQEMYDALRSAGVPAEDARAVLPNAVSCNMVMTANLTALLSFYAKRRKGNGAQSEIAELAEAIRKAVVAVEGWTDEYFEKAGKK